MKTTKKAIMLICSLVLLFTCSKDENESGSKPDELVRYLNTPDSNNQLISMAFIAEDDASTFIYGNTDSNGELLRVTSLAYKETNSNTVFYIILDDLLRVKEIYSETNGTKDEKIQSFSYPEENLVNFIVKNRNWTTSKETIKHFSTVEIDGDNFNSRTLFGKSSGIKGVEWNVLKSWIGVAIGVAAAAITIYIAPTILAGVLAGVLFTGAVFANEQPIENINSNAPIPPTQVTNICTNSNLEVIVGVDPGSVLVAIVNGNSASYKFYWSTGDSGTGLISHSITAPDDGIYYVLVEDDNGCVAFGSSLGAKCEGVTDIDGNIYSSVKIGNQCWMQKNLNVTKYRNGDPIPQVTDPTAWENLTTGAWCYYENEMENGTKYGKLYNWYAVNDPRGLAPYGWHVPSTAEWDILIDTLGGLFLAGGKMKDRGIEDWNGSNTGATNSSSFTGLPGGFRYNFGVYYNMRNNGYWWTSTLSFYETPSYKMLSYDDSVVRSHNNLDKSTGYSVRCIR